MESYHLLPAGGKWRIVAEGSERSLAEYDTKAEALEKCAMLEVGEPRSLKIHREDGTFEEERTYPRSADPRETSG